MTLESDLQKRISEVLYYEWDPIGVRSFEPSARDEYDSYVPVLAQDVMKGASASQIEKSLYRIETEEIELKCDSEKRKYSAELIMSWYEYLTNDENDRK